MNGMNTLI